MTIDQLIEKIKDLINEILDKRIRENKISPESEAVSLKEFERVHMINYDGDEVIHQSFFRKFLHHLEPFFNWNIENLGQATLSKIKFLTPKPQKSIEDGEIPAVVQNLVLTGETLPEVPTPPETTPDLAGFDFEKHLLPGQLALNEDQNEWYYRAKNIIYKLKDSLHLCISDIQELATILTNIEGDIVAISDIQTQLNIVLEGQGIQIANIEEFINQLQNGNGELWLALNGLNDDVYRKNESDNRYSLNGHDHQGEYETVQNVAQLRAMIFDQDDYFDGSRIKPNTIQTQMLEVGSRSSQMMLRATLEANYQGDPNKVNISSGQLFHFTIDATIKSWNLSPTLAEGLVLETPYYIYARCEKLTQNGQIVVDPTQRKVNDDPDYYYFLIGVLHSAIEGVRAISLTYGHTTIHGKFITTGRIQSQDANTYFDLDTGEFRGTFKFSNGADLEEVLLAQSILIQDHEERLLIMGEGADQTKTIIDGGLVTTGTLAVGQGTLLEIKAGLTGAGLETEAVRFWAGSLYSERESAPFRVLDDGSLFASKGQISGFAISPDGLIHDTGIDPESSGMSPDDFPFYAGATYANRHLAPFRVDAEGKAYLTNATIQSSLEGKRIEVNSVYNRFQLIDNNTVVIEIDAGDDESGSGFPFVGTYRFNEDVMIQKGMYTSRGIYLKTENTGKTQITMFTEPGWAIGGVFGFTYEYQGFHYKYIVDENNPLLNHNFHISSLSNTITPNALRVVMQGLPTLSSHVGNYGVVCIKRNTGELYVKI